MQDRTPEVLLRVAWNEAKVKQALGVLSRHSTIDGAARELKMTVATLDQGLKRNGKTAREHLAPSPAKMLEQRSDERERQSLRREREALLDQLQEANARSSFLDKMRPTPPVIVAREKTSGRREGTAVALASDWHVEEVVRSASVAGRNEYNLDIAEQRAGRFFSSLRWLIESERQSFAVRDLVLWLGGDLITGYIHEELAETNSLSPVEAVLHVKQILSNGIASLLQDSKLERLVIPCSYGNHGRTTHKRRIKTGAQNSYEWLMYNVLAHEFAKEKRVVFEITQSAHQYVQAYGETLHFHHGDEVRYWGGVGGLSIPLNKRRPKWENVKASRYHHIGHFHQRVDLGHTLVNGSLIGYTEYAFSEGCDFERPEQTFYMLDSKHGKCKVTPIWVEK